MPEHYAEPTKLRCKVQGVLKNEILINKSILVFPPKNPFKNTVIYTIYLSLFSLYSLLLDSTPAIRIETAVYIMVKQLQATIATRLLRYMKHNVP